MLKTLLSLIKPAKIFLPCNISLCNYHCAHTMMLIKRYFMSAYDQGDVEQCYCLTHTYMHGHTHTHTRTRTHTHMYTHTNTHTNTHTHKHTHVHTHTHILYARQ